MTTSDRPVSLHRMSRRGFGLLLPWGGLAALTACSKNPEPATPAAADPALSPAPTPAAAPATVPATTSDAAASASGTASGTAGAGMPLVDPADPSAKALAYTADAAQVVAASNPKYQPGQACGNCALYGGQPGNAAGPCPLYPGKQVSAIAWCNAYAKKAA